MQQVQQYKCSICPQTQLTRNQTRSSRKTITITVKENKEKIIIISTRYPIKSQKGVEDLKALVFIFIVVFTGKLEKKITGKCERVR